MILIDCVIEGIGIHHGLGHKKRLGAKSENEIRNANWTAGTKKFIIPRDQIGIIEERKAVYFPILDGIAQEYVWLKVLIKLIFYIKIHVKST